MAYSVNGAKTFRGHDGVGFNANLLRDGKKVALVTNLADGGEMQIEWLDFKKPRVEITRVGYDGKEYKYRGTPEEKLLVEFLADKTYISEFDGSMVRHTIDTFIDDLVCSLLDKKKFDRLSRTKTLFRLKGDKPDSWRSVNRPYSEQVQAWLDENYGDKLETVYRP